MEIKTCSTCKKDKVFPDCFYRDRRTKSGYSGRCKECDGAIKRSPEALARRQRRYKRDPEKTRECQRQWRKKNRIKIREYQKQWSKRNPEKIRKYQKGRKRLSTPQSRERERNYRRKYLARKRATDPEYCKWKAEHDKKYRQSLKGKISAARAKAKRRTRSDKWKVTPSQWECALKAFEYKCAYCGCVNDLTIDHFIPLYHGGQSVIGNVVPACLSCNSSKQHKMPQEWCSETQLRRVLDILSSL